MDQDRLTQIFEGINTPLNTVALFVLLLCGLYYTFRSRFVQFRLLPDMFKLITDKKEGGNGMSPFRSFAMAMGACVGTGNLAGVATAIFVGGPGAIFWMWMMALVGGVNSFLECTLAQMYKTRHGEHFLGGPAYYIRKGIGSHTMAVVFAISIIVNYGFVNIMLQSTQIVAAWTNAFQFPTWLMACLVTGVTMFIVFGGVRRISAVNAWLVPLMAISYILLAVIILGLNYEAIPEAFRVIFAEAFHPSAAVGGGIGTCILIGFRRGLFSNEAGLGSAPNAAAVADTTHPAKQGLLHVLTVYFDTIIICTLTALIILCSGLYTQGIDGIALTQAALCQYIGPVGKYLIAILILVFAFSSIISDTYYGETNIRYLKNNERLISTYKIVLGVTVMIACLSHVTLIWQLLDFTQAIMAICNIVALLIVGRKAVECLKDYERQHREKKNPHYVNSSLECWQEEDNLPK